jgi:hypothetical protein
MKISHTQLETCLKGPRAWLQAKLAAPSQYFSIGYNRALLFGIYNFHKTKQATIARQYLSDLIQSRGFKDLARIEEIELAFESYVHWCEAENVAVADSRVLVRLDSGYLSLVGEVSRVDVAPDSYRAVLLGPFQPNWRNELRMPLLQKAIGEKFSRPISEVSVGVQQLDGSDLQVHSYSRARLAKAEMGFKKLSHKLLRYAPKWSAAVP